MMLDYNISWKTIDNTRNKKGLKHFATSAGHIAPTLVKSTTAPALWIIKLIARINQKRIS